MAIRLVTIPPSVSQGWVGRSVWECGMLEAGTRSVAACAAFLQDIVGLRLTATA